MFSSRFHWDLQRNRLTELLAARRGQGARILDLTQSNPTRAGIEYPEELRRVFDDPGLLRYDPAPAGSLAAREAVADYYRQRGQAVEPSRILLTASTSEGYSYLFKLLADPGDQVLVPQPSYPLFEYLARMESIEVRQYPLEYHAGWAIDMDALAGAITARTRAVVLVNPNNPTGSYVKRGELEALTRIAAGRGIALISDEVFSDYAFAPDAGRVTSVAERGRLRGVFAERAVENCRPAADEAGLDRGGGPAAAARRSHGEAGVDRRHVSFRGTPVQCAAARLLECGAAVQRQIQQRTAANLAFARQALAGTATRDPGGGRRLVDHHARAARPHGRRMVPGTAGRATTSWCSPATSTISKLKRSLWRACSRRPQSFKRASRGL